MVLVGSERYSAGANVRCHLQRIIQALSRTIRFGFGLYDVGIVVNFHLLSHSFVHEVRPLSPILLCASVFDADQMTLRLSLIHI